MLCWPQRFVFAPDVLTLTPLRPATKARPGRPDGPVPIPIGRSASSKRVTARSMRPGVRKEYVSGSD